MIAWFTGLSVLKKVGVGLGALLLIILVVTGLVLAVNAHDVAQRQAGRDEVTAKWNAERATRAQALADFSSALGTALQPRFDNLATQIGGIETAAARVNVELPRALAADPRYRDPNCSLTPVVLGQLNAARGAGK